MAGNIVIKGEDLHGEHGAYARALARCQAENTGATEWERRHILVGELGEIAVGIDLERQGFNVEHRSWREFRYGLRETSTDIFAQKNELILRVQVKASEAGNRCVSAVLVNKYIETGVNRLIFVAVREVPEYGGIESHFTCEITSQMLPQQMSRLATWELKHSRWQHKENESFMKLWQEKTRKQNKIARLSCS